MGGVSTTLLYFYPHMEETGPERLNKFLKLLWLAVAEIGNESIPKPCSLSGMAPLGSSSQSSDPRVVSQMQI